MFGKNNTGWIDVDFSRWGSNPEEREKFNIFKAAILHKTMVLFNYFGSNGKKTERTVEPLELVLKGYAWYVYAFCHIKNDFRFFKVSRIKNLKKKEQVFDAEVIEPKIIRDGIKNRLEECLKKYS